jgi:hypothetical protein
MLEDNPDARMILQEGGDEFKERTLKRPALTKIRMSCR